MDGITIENNTVYNNGFYYGDLDSAITAGQGQGYGIWLDTQVHGIVRYNFCYNNVRSGIYLEKTDSSDVYYNISIDNIDSGIKLNSQGDAGSGGGDGSCEFNEVYNNVCFGNDTRGIYLLGGTTVNDSLTISGGMSRNKIKNNISSGNDTQEFEVLGGGTNDGIFGEENEFLNNCFGAAAANFIEWRSGTFISTYAVFDDSVGSATLSAESDPLWTDSANDDFTLQTGSPAIDTGVDVGLVRDYLGNGKVGSAWDMGAYEWFSTGFNKWIYRNTRSTWPER
jgi:hypothetical protein